MSNALGISRQDLDQALRRLQEQQRRYVNNRIASINTDISNYASVAKQCEMLTDGVTTIGLDSVTKSVTFKSVLNADVNSIRIQPHTKSIQEVRAINFEDRSRITGITDDLDNEDATKAASMAVVKNFNGRLDKQDERLDKVEKKDKEQDDTIDDIKDKVDQQEEKLSKAVMYDKRVDEELKFIKYTLEADSKGVTIVLHFNDRVVSYLYPSKPLFKGRIVMGSGTNYPKLELNYISMSPTVATNTGEVDYQYWSTQTETFSDNTIRYRFNLKNLFVPKLDKDNSYIESVQVENFVKYPDEPRYEINRKFITPNITAMDNKITDLEKAVNAMFDQIYPIGSLYISVTGDKPPIGKWEILDSDYYLVNATWTSGMLGQTTGSYTHTHETKDHTLTLDQIPSHSHEVRGGWGEGSYDKTRFRADGNSPATPWQWTGSTGGGKAHNHGATTSASNQPWSLYVAMFKRVA